MACDESWQAKKTDGPRKRKRIKHKKKEGFSLETREAAHQRSKGQCETPDCGRPVEIGGEHHCLPRSQYSKKDRNGLWNCANICQICHEEITFPKTPRAIQKRRFFELLALLRRDGGKDEDFTNLIKDYLNNSISVIQQKYRF